VEDIAAIKVNRKYDLSAPKGVNGRNSENTRIKEYLNWEPDTALRVGMEKNLRLDLRPIPGSRARRRRVVRESFAVGKF